MESVLQNCTGVIEEPYPHIIIKDALSPEYYQALYESLPSWQQIIPDKFHHLSNKRGNLPWFKVVEGDYPQIWKDFVQYHVSTEFYEEFLYWFEPYIIEQLPLVEKQYGRLEDLPLKKKTRTNNSPFCQDVMISATTPVKELSSVRGKHIDGLNKLSAGLFYMKNPNDNAGGNLEIYECSGVGTFDTKNKWSNMSYPSEKKVGEVEYAPNTFVMLLNTKKSLHAVTQRQPTNESRTFVNFHGQFDRPIIQPDTRASR